MIRFIYGNDISSIKWEIYQNYNFGSIKYLDSNCDINKLYHNFFQTSLFQSEEMFAIDITKFDFKSKQVIDFLNSIVSIDSDVILFTENKNFKIENLTNIVGAKNIKSKKVYLLNETDLHKMTNKIIDELSLNISVSNRIYLEKILLPDYDLVKNELQKLKLLNKDISIEDIKETVFEYSQPAIFKIIDFYINRKKNLIVKTINDLVSNKQQIVELIPALSQQIFQLKLYDIAKKNNWDFNMINSTYNMSYYQQKIYSEMLYNINANRINMLLNDFYELDLNIKLQKVEPYSALISILLKE